MGSFMEGGLNGAGGRRSHRWGGPGKAEERSLDPNPHCGRLRLVSSVLQAQVQQPHWAAWALLQGKGMNVDPQGAATASYLG